eukprot:4898815-Amphidinium_carterae.1
MPRDCRYVDKPRVIWGVVIHIAICWFIVCAMRIKALHMRRQLRALLAVALGTMASAASGPV